LKILNFWPELLDPDFAKMMESLRARVVPEISPPFGALAILQARIARSCRSDLNRAFVWWLLRNPEGRAEFASIATMAAEREGADPDFSVAATLGFAAESGLLSALEMAAFKDGLTKLTGSAPVANGIPLTFHADAAGVLGVALGTAVIADLQTTKLVAGWAAGFLKTSYGPDRAEDWERCLLSVADRRIGHPLGLAVPTSDETADVRIALLSVGLLDDYAPRDVALTLALTRGNGTRDFGCERLALHLKALQWINSLGSSAAAKLRPSSLCSGENPDVQVSPEPFRSGSIPVPPNEAAEFGIATAPEVSGNLVTQPDAELIRRNKKYEMIDTALREIGAAEPKNHEEVFRDLDDRNVVLPNGKLFKGAGGWMKGFKQNRNAASAWLSKAWTRLSLSPFVRGPKK
jgi:hypothetical protein